MPIPWPVRWGVKGILGKRFGCGRRTVSLFELEKLTNQSPKGELSSEKCHVTFVSRVWSYGRRGGRRSPYFVVAKRDLEEQTGTRLEEGKIYQLSGKVDDVFEFHRNITIRSDRYIRLYVPLIEVDKLRPDEDYRIVILELKNIHGNVRTDSKRSNQSNSRFQGRGRECIALTLTKAYRVP